MRAYPQKHGQTQREKSVHPPRPFEVARRSDVHPILHMQRTIGNQAVRRLLQEPNPGDLEARSSSKEIIPFGDDLGGIPVRTRSMESVRFHTALRAAGSGVLRRQPKEGEKADEPAAKFTGCEKDRLPVVRDAIKKAEALAARAVQAFERDYPLSYESAAMKAHFGSVGSDQKATIIERYQHGLANLGSKTYTCAKDNQKVKEGGQVTDLCGQASCPGNKITVFPIFGSETCPAGPVMLHEAMHNAGACDDINKGSSRYPPSSSEDNAYSYEYFALDVTAGYKAPELGKRRPAVPKP